MVTIVTNAKFPRYLIQHYGRWWNGQKWVLNREEARLYTDHQIVSREAAHLEKTFKKQTTILNVPTHIIIESPWGFDLREMKRALVHHVDVKYGRPPLLPANAELNMICFLWNQTQVEQED